MQKLQTFITCNENAVAMMEYYHRIFDNAKIESQVFFPNDNPDAPKLLLTGKLTIHGSTLLFMDMQKEYYKEYSHSISLLITVDSEEQFYRYFNPLKEQGTVMMGPEPVMDIQLCTWVTDKFGLTWQIVKW